MAKISVINDMLIADAKNHKKLIIETKNGDCYTFTLTARDFEINIYDNFVWIKTIQGTQYFNKEDISVITFNKNLQRKLRCPKCLNLVESLHPDLCLECMEKGEKE